MVPSSLHGRSVLALVVVACDEPDPVSPVEEEAPEEGCTQEVHDTGTAIWEGDLLAEDVAGFCERHCARTIDGNLFLQQSTLTSLADLWCLTWLRLDLVVEDNPELASLAGLEQLSHARSVIVVGNPELTSLRGLEALTSVGYLTLEDTEVTSLSGLEGLVEVESGLYLQGNDALTSLQGLGNLESSVGWTSYELEIQLRSNRSLASLDGLERIVGLRGLLLEDNDALTSLRALESLHVVEDALVLEGNDALTSLWGLQGLLSIGRTLQYDGHQDLQQSNLSIRSNRALTDLVGLGNLLAVEDNLVIEGNPSLYGVQPLYGLLYVGDDVSILDNFALTDAAAQALIDEIEVIGGAVTISGN